MHVEAQVDVGDAHRHPAEGYAQGCGTDGRSRTNVPLARTWCRALSGCSLQRAMVGVRSWHSGAVFMGTCRVGWVGGAQGENPGRGSVRARVRGPRKKMRVAALILNSLRQTEDLDPDLNCRLGHRMAGLQRKEPVASARFLAVQLHESWSWSAVVRVGQHWILWCRPDRTANPTSITATRLCFSPGIRLQSIDATQRVYVVAFRTAVLQSSPCRREKTHRSARSPS